MTTTTSTAINDEVNDSREKGMHRISNRRKKERELKAIVKKHFVYLFYFKLFLFHH